MVAVGANEIYSGDRVLKNVRLDDPRPGGDDRAENYRNCWVSIEYWGEDCRLRIFKLGFPAVDWDRLIDQGLMYLIIIMLIKN